LHTMNWPILKEQINVALSSIRSNSLRTLLTVAIIGLGIMALISMTTATSALGSTVEQEFAALGATGFTFKQKRQGGMHRGKVISQGEPITYREAARFRNDANPELLVGLSVFGSATATLGHGNERTNPNIQVLGVDERYLTISGFEIGDGRNMTRTERESGAPVAVVGIGIISDLFDEWDDPIGKDIRIESKPYRVIGILKEQGSTFGMSQDNQCLIPIGAVRGQFGDSGRSYSVTCKAPNPAVLDEMSDEALGLMRAVRRDRPGQEHSFEMTLSTSLIASVREATANISIAATVIGIITLFGAGIGLMNIMLVSVSERTREIGLRKSMGATSRVIRMQFLVEVMLIGQLGGLVGTLAGVAMGNVIAYVLKAPFTIPWNWIILGVTLSLLTSLISGYYPARKAARLDPILAMGRV
jgi:putative ABC transport system permease protein